MENKFTNLTQAQKNKLLALAEIADKGELAIIQKLFEYDDYFTQFKDSVSNFVSDINDIKTKINEVSKLQESSNSSTNSELKKIVDEFSYSISDLEISINEKINTSEKKTLGFIKELSARFSLEIDRVEREIPIVPPETDLSNIENRIKDLESKPDSPAPKEETGNSIVDKINSLPVESDNDKIAREHIRGLEDELRDIRYKIIQSSSGRGGGVNGLTQVYHDSTLSGTGTQSSPLTVLGGGTWYQDEVVATGVTGTSFTLLNTPTNIVFLYKNGQYLVSGVSGDYTRSGKNVTLAVSLLSTDILTANYS